MLQTFGHQLIKFVSHVLQILTIIPLNSNAFLVLQVLLMILALLLVKYTPVLPINHSGMVQNVLHVTCHNIGIITQIDAKIVQQEQTMILELKNV